MKKRFIILLAGTFVFFLKLYQLDLAYITDGFPVSVVQKTGLDQENKASSQSSSNTAPSKQTEKPKSSPHEGFVYLIDVLPEAKFDVRYATAHNFTGQVVNGYLTDKISITVEAAKALQKVSDIFKKEGYGLLIYDAYRPKRAVSFFTEWGKQPENNVTKAEFYPNIDKKDLSKLGYLARRSAHSRGSAVDLTLYDLKTGSLLDMGSPFDLLDPISNHGTDVITQEHTENRNLLKKAMKSAGFKEIRTEWWHYQLINEPYPETYFDFAID